MGRKIGSRIAELAFHNGVKKGFKYGCGFIVNEKSRHLFLKEGYKTFSAINREKFEYEGKKVVAKVPINCPIELVFRKYE